MAGWAGWRGKDKIGSVYLFFDKRKLNYYQDLELVLEQLMTKPVEALKSKYKLTYKIIMFTLTSSAGSSISQGQKQIRDLMKKSFFENDNQKERIAFIEQYESLEEELKTIDNINSLEYTESDV